jgi:hypothetical protein
MTFSRPHLATRLLLPALLCLGMTGHAVAEDHEHEHAQRHEGKHVHGVAELNIAQQGTQLYLELHSPAMNIVGYEHAPASDLDQEALDKAVATLKQGARLFVFNEQAACRAVEVELNSALIGSAEPTAEHEAHEAHHGHADFDADYLFHCDAPEHLESIDVRLFKAFPGTHALHVQYIVGNRQGAAELNAQQPGLSFQH